MPHPPPALHLLHTIGRRRACYFSAGSLAVHASLPALFCPAAPLPAAAAYETEYTHTLFVPSNAAATPQLHPDASKLNMSHIVHTLRFGLPFPGQVSLVVYLAFSARSSLLCYLTVRGPTSLLATLPPALLLCCHWMSAQTLAALSTHHRPNLVEGR